MATGICKYGLAALLALTAHAAAAQGYAGWRVYRAEGEIVHTRDGKRSIYRGAGAGSLTLLARDMIQTGEGMAELQISPSGREDANYTVLRMGANTSVMVNGLEPGALSLDFLYGQLRIALGSGDKTVTIRSGNVVSVLEECDAALEYTARPGVTQPRLSAYCFRGRGELNPRSQVQTAEAAPLLLREGEGISVEYQTPFVYVERRALEDAVLAYWIAHPFDAAPLPMPAVGLSRRTVRETPAAPPPPSRSRTDRRAGGLSGNTGRIKNGYSILGFLFMGAGAAMQGYVHFADPGGETRDQFLYGGYGALTLGSVFLLGGALYNPPPAPAPVPERPPSE